ncbi:hypothetical protein AGLY_002514 [Aphis glycines]|uniref:Uncharacterized protein n=1 Tax=Aphis glycines TaxID=307491 RepID=A0A6G0U0Y8_APHGL|nr:hypothetical protein AGLY_002514 [Aphis glycines]
MDLVSNGQYHQLSIYSPLIISGYRIHVVITITAQQLYNNIDEVFTLKKLVFRHVFTIHALPNNSATYKCSFLAVQKKKQYYFATSYKVLLLIEIIIVEKTKQSTSSNAFLKLNNNVSDIKLFQYNNVIYCNERFSLLDGIRGIVGTQVEPISILESLHHQFVESQISLLILIHHKIK